MQLPGPEPEFSSLLPSWMSTLGQCPAWTTIHVPRHYILPLRCSHRRRWECLPHKTFSWGNKRENIKEYIAYTDLALFKWEAHWHMCCLLILTTVPHSTKGGMVPAPPLSWEKAEAAKWNNLPMESNTDTSSSQVSWCLGDIPSSTCGFQFCLLSVCTRAYISTYVCIYVSVYLSIYPYICHLPSFPPSLPPSFIVETQLFFFFLKKKVPTDEQSRLDWI